MEEQTDSENKDKGDITRQNFNPQKHTWGEINEKDIISVTDVNGAVHKLIEASGEYCSIEWAKRGFMPDPRLSYPKIREMEIRDDDILICAYAKAGTHWLWEITKMLMKKSAEYEILPKEATMLEFHMPDDFREMTSPRALNTHLDFRNLPKQAIQKKCKIIHILRNPKDVAVSLFCHRQNASLHITNEWDNFLRLFETESDRLTTWFSYTLEWEKEIAANKDLPILSLYYEEIKRNPVEEIQKLAQFLEVSCDGDLAKQIADRCSFTNLKKANNEVKIDIFQPETYKKPVTKRNDFLYRKGEVGDWKNWFTVAQNERFDKCFQEWMKSSELTFMFTI